MGRYPFLVELAWHVTEAFVADWQREPFLWDRERDIQVALASRLSTVLLSLGKGTVEGEYTGTGFKGIQTYSRISCEPPLRISVRGKTRICYPDVVLWDDLSDPHKPPADWPALWACEIKYGAGSRPIWISYDS